MTKTTPFTVAQLEEIVAQHPTPFHLYDEKAIRANARRLKAAFAWNKGFREFFAVKATPNPHLMALLREEGFGSDCSSMAELVLAEAVGNVGESIMFTSNDTPAEEFLKAAELGAIINLDDITHWDFLVRTLKAAGKPLPELMCCRWNPGPLKGGNAIIGKPEEAKYGFTKPQLIECYRAMKAAGVKRFGLHTMVASNELDPQYIIDTATLLFDLVAEISAAVGITFEFINIGGGVGIPYRPDQKAMDLEFVGKGIEAACRERLTSKGLPEPKLYMECGRCITGPYGWLVARVRHIKKTYKTYVGLDACMANLMRPALYGAYHHITLPSHHAHGRGRRVASGRDMRCDGFALREQRQVRDRPRAARDASGRSRGDPRRRRARPCDGVPVQRQAPERRAAAAGGRARKGDPTGRDARRLLRHARLPGAEGLTPVFPRFQERKVFACV